MTEELFINGHLVDLNPDASITLNFKSNLLGDISKITSSNSQTIQCPKTTRNRVIFDNPGAPAYVSDRRYKRYSASLVQNGIEVVRVGYAVLLSSSETYEIALYWGVMANFQAWVDKGAKLNELDGAETMAWNKNVAISTVEQLTTNGYGYAEYDCGVADTELVNIHPSATAWWILGKIAAQAGFRIEMPGRYVDALKSIAIPCLGLNASAESNEAEATKALLSPGFAGELAIESSNVIQDVRHLARLTGGVGAIRTENLANKLYLRLKGLSSSPFTITIAKTSAEAMKVYALFLKFNDSGGIAESEYKRILVSIGKDDVKDTSSFTFPEFFGEFDVDGWDAVAITYSPYSAVAGVRLSTSCTLYAWSNWDDIIYPGPFPLLRNLPEIAQIDFVKAICAMLGIFVVADPIDSDVLKFVSLETLDDNKARALDWSQKLIRSNGDEPKTTAFKIGDYCRNNLFRYKEDEAVEMKADGNLKVDNETLEAEKTIITLPFAPSDGSTIQHYELQEDEGGNKSVSSLKVADRVMLIAEHEGKARLRFQGLEFETLLTKYYTGLSRLLNSAMTITEQMRISEADLKTLDFTVPFYLRQYGKYYGIESIQTSTGKPCEVKAIQLPDSATLDPTKPSCQINYEVSDNVVLTATRPLHSDVSVRYVIYTIDDHVEHTTLFPSGATECVTPYLVTRNFDRVEILELNPTEDDMYNYLIV